MPTWRWQRRSGDGRRRSRHAHHLAARCRRYAHALAPSAASSPRRRTIREPASPPKTLRLTSPARDVRQQHAVRVTPGGGALPGRRVGGGGTHARGHGCCQCESSVHRAWGGCPEGLGGGAGSRPARLLGDDGAPEDADTGPTRQPTEGAVRTGGSSLKVTRGAAAVVCSLARRWASS